MVFFLCLTSRDHVYRVFISSLVRWCYVHVSYFKVDVDLIRAAVPRASSKIFVASSFVDLVLQLLPESKDGSSSKKSSCSSSSSSIISIIIVFLVDFRIDDCSDKKIPRLVAGTRKKNRRPSDGERKRPRVCVPEGGRAGVVTSRLPSAEIVDATKCVRNYKNHSGMLPYATMWHETLFMTSCSRQMRTVDGMCAADGDR